MGKEALWQNILLSILKKLGAETIAFIFPDTFSKVSNQSFTLFPKEWRLIVEHRLSNCFFDMKGEPYKVLRSFFIWTRQLGDFSLRKEILQENEDFFVFAAIRKQTFQSMAILEK